MSLCKYLLVVATCLVMFSCTDTQPEFFEGKISLRLLYYDSLGNEVAGEVIDRDTEMHYYVDAANYKTINQDGVLTQLYNGETNQYYFNNQNQFQVVDAAYKYPLTGEVQKLEGTEEVDGRTCSKVRIKSEAETTTYFYSDEVKVDGALYARHNFWNWNRFMEASQGALPLKYVVQFPAMTVVMEAYDVERLDLSAEDFNIESYTGKE